VAAFDRPVPEIGRGGLYDVPSLSPRAEAGRPVGDLSCGRSWREAFGVLESYCSKYFARGFKLYKLYERAAVFVGH